jgi:RNA polymerase sigma factor (sigma-70 family)
MPILHAETDDEDHDAPDEGRMLSGLPGAGLEEGDDECTAGLPADAPVCSGLAATLDAEALATLIARVVNQDQAALAALYDALSGRVFASALRITRQVAAAEEVMQDTFWQVWRQAPRFDAQRGHAVAWVLNIARSRALDAVRALQRDHLHQQALVQGELEDRPHDPMELLHGGQRDSRLQQTLALLDPLKRQLIALAYYRGLTQDEIAVQTGLPLGTVKSHLRRTLTLLREALGADAADQGLDAAA